jgi:hypothetical protein
MWQHTRLSSFRLRASISEDTEALKVCEVYIVPLGLEVVPEDGVIPENKVLGYKPYRL